MSSHDNRRKFGKFIRFVLGLICSLYSPEVAQADLKATAKRLLAIAKAVEKQEKICAKLNYRIQGENRVEVTGRRELPSEKPESFVYAAQGNRLRYEHEWHLPNESIRCIRLVDGTHYYRASGKRVLVFPQKPEELAARREFGPLEGIRQPIYEGEGMSLANRLRWFAEQIQSPESAHLWSRGLRSFSLDEQPDRVTIRDVPDAEQTGTTFELILDPQHSYRAVKWRIESGSDPTKWYYTCQIEPSYCDADETESLIVGGTMVVSESGTVVAGTEREGTITSHVDAGQVEIGNFEVPADFFDAASLPPIPKRRGVAWYP
jgi:hypothetical protein